MDTAPKNESPLRLLWVRGADPGPENALMSAFSAHCHVQDVPLARIPWDTARPDWDAICFDFDHPSLTDLARVAKAHARWSGILIVLFTKRCSCALALWGLRLGIFDLLTKPLATADVALSVRRLREALVERHDPPQRNAPRAPPDPLAHLSDDHMHSAMERLNRAKDYIDLHYTRSLPQAEVAFVCEMSTSWFSREFKNQFGSNFLEYLTHHRVLHAQRLLSESSLSIAAIAIGVGFTDPAYFTRVFRRFAGMSPTQYREYSGSRAIGQTRTLDQPSRPPESRLRKLAV
jgi:AraC-like DNA-binding protein